MKKQQQKEINENVTNVFDNIAISFCGAGVKRLYNCQAEILEKDGLLYLKSYNTVVAVFDVPMKILYDGLRYVYGYTATSAQHIAKFRNYCRETYGLDWNDITEYRYYPV